MSWAPWIVIEGQGSTHEQHPTLLCLLAAQNTRMQCVWRGAARLHHGQRAASAAQGVQESVRCRLAERRAAFQCNGAIARHCSPLAFISKFEVATPVSLPLSSPGSSEASLTMLVAFCLRSESTDAETASLLRRHGTGCAPAAAQAKALLGSCRAWSQESSRRAELAMTGVHSR